MIFFATSQPFLLLDLFCPIYEDKYANLMIFNKF